MHRSRLAMFLGACLASAGAAAQSPLFGGEEEEPSFPTVITPARLRQSLVDVPASVTVLTGVMLRRYGIRTVPEALRLVPGMSVIHAPGPEYAISQHGTNILSPRRMNVLIDGISVYRPAFSEVLWTQLPVTVDEIDRIEVTRGPSSAAYGPNSMLAVVNIVTTSPLDANRASGSPTVGTESTLEAAAGGAIRFGSTAASLGAKHARDSGFNEVARDTTGHDSLRVDRVNFRSHTSVSPIATFSAQISVARGTVEVPFADDFQITYPDRHFQDVYAGGVWNQTMSPRQELQISVSHARQRTRQPWRTCPPTAGFLPELFSLWRANPAYADALLLGRPLVGGTPEDNALALAALVAIRRLGPAALAPTCATTNQNAVQTRTEIEVQDTYVLSDRMRVVAGLGIRRQAGESQTFLGGTEAANIRWVFGNVESRPVDWLTLNLGGYYESSSLSPNTFSPRAAANFHVASGQTVRVVLSEGTRSPDIQEQRTNWTYTGTDLDPPFRGSTTGRLYQSRIGPGNLVSERILSREIGYLLNIPRYGLLLDARVFHDRLTRLISQRTNLAGDVPTNEGAVNLRGTELQTSIALSSVWSGFLNYSYLQNRGATNPLERTMYSRHSGAVGASRDLGGEWQASIAYYGASGDGLQQSSYGRTDLTLIKSGKSHDTRWATTLGLRRLDDRTTTYSIGSPQPLFARYSSRLQGFIQLSVQVQ